MTNPSTEQTEQSRRPGRPRKTPAVSPTVSAPAPETNTDNIKTELTRYLDEKLDERFIDRLDAMNKKLLREKNRKIWFRNILILLLLVLVSFETCALFQRGFFDSLLNRVKTEEIQSAGSTSETSSAPAEKAPSLSELKEKYASLLTPFRLSKNSAYLSDFNSGNLSNELKLYFALNSLDFGALEIEEDYNLVDKSALAAAAEKLFASADLSFTSFDYNENRLRYMEKLNSFISLALLKKSDNLVDFEISEIKEESDSKVIIKTSDNLAFTFKDKKLVSLSKIN